MVKGILGRILAEKQGEVDAVRARAGELRRRARDAPPARDFAAALRPAGPATPCVIAEIKRASPSAGPIRPGADPAAIAAEYQKAGAAALSVLTDARFFDGALAHLQAVRARVPLPLLRKDFIVDEAQIWEARVAGADAVLLLAAVLGDDALAELSQAAAAAGLAALVEVHDEAELGRAAAAGARIIGVNHRDLGTFQMDMGLFARLRPLFPAGALGVAESGIRVPADVAALGAAGADAILVGESLMRHPSPGAGLRELLGSAR